MDSTSIDTLYVIFIKVLKVLNHMIFLRIDS